MKTLHRFHNAEVGLAASVVRVPKGFAVSLRDTDADETLPTVLIFQSEKQAVAEAKKLVR